MTPRRALASLLVVLACAALGHALHRWLFGHTLEVPVITPTVRLAHPERLALVSAIPVVLWATHLSLANLARGRRRLALALRSGLVVTLAAALSEPVQLSTHARMAVALAVDISDSIPDEALRIAERLLEDVRARAGDSARVHTITFARDARRHVGGDQPLRAVLGQVGGAEPQAAASGAVGEATNPARALQLAYGLLPADRVRRVVLVSDGLETRGDVLSEAVRARSLGIQIDTLALRAPPPPEVAIASVDLPDEVEVGATFVVQVRIHATRSGRAAVRLYQDDVLNGLGGTSTIDLREGENMVTFRSLCRIAGPVRYRVELEPEGADRFPQNNQAETSTWASGRPRVLLVDGSPERLTLLASALSAADYDVELRSDLALPQTSAELAAFDFVMVSNVPAERLGAAPARAIERYVRRHGGGFMLVGGDHGFGLGGFAGTRIERMLPVRMDSERRRDEHSLALSLVIDTSGSMSGPKMALAKEAAKAAADLLADGDLIEVIGFSSTPARIVRLQAASNRARIARDIGRLVAQGGTAIFPALDTAYQDLGLARARVKHIILLTDGQTQESGIPELARAMRSEGITVSTVGLGRDVNRSLLQNAANLGDGRAYFTDDPNHVPRIFMRETSTVAKDQAVEEPVVVLRGAPADFLADIPIVSAPVLNGYVSTQAKGRPAQVILVSEFDEPILARTRLGLGWSLAWTSDLHPRWASNWLRWRGFVPFIGQLVREHMRKPTHERLPLQLRVDQGRLLAEVDALGKDDRFINDLSSTIRVSPLVGAGARSGSQPQSASDEMSERPLELVAPGRYATHLPLPGYGALSVEAAHRRDGRLWARSRAQLLHPYPEEYARTEPDLGLLTRVAQAGGGLVDPGPDQVLAPRGRSVPRRRPLWPGLAGLSLALFLTDLATRRTGHAAA